LSLRPSFHFSKAFPLGFVVLQVSAADLDAPLKVPGLLSDSSKRNRIDELVLCETLLQALWLSGTPLTDNCLPHLAELKEFTYADWGGTK
jgi:hypothetical protein